MLHLARMGNRFRGIEKCGTPAATVISNASKKGAQCLCKSAGFEQNNKRMQASEEMNTLEKPLASAPMAEHSKTPEMFSITGRSLSRNLLEIQGNPLGRLQPDWLTI